MIPLAADAGYLMIPLAGGRRRAEHGSGGGLQCELLDARAAAEAFFVAVEVVHRGFRPAPAVVAAAVVEIDEPDALHFRADASISCFQRSINC